MFGRLSTKIRPSAAIAGAVCLTLILGGNTLAFANDVQPAPQPEIAAEAGDGTETQSSGQSGQTAEETTDDAASSDDAHTVPAAPDEAAPAVEDQPAAPVQPRSFNPFRNAQGATSDDLEVSLTVKADGTPDFDQNDDAGNDSGANNGIVRVNDTVTYTLQYRSAVGKAENFTAKVVFPKGVYMTDLPGTCQQPGSSLTPADPTANVTLPLTADSRDQLQEQTLLCNLGSTETAALRVDLVARVSNLVHHNQPLQIQAVSATADNLAETPTKTPLPSVNASAALKWDVSKNSMAETGGYAYGPAFEPCFWDSSRACFAIRYNIVMSAPAGGKGAMPAIGDVTFTEDLTFRSLYPGRSEADYQKMEANPEKYGSRSQSTAGDTFYAIPGSKIGERSNGVLNTEKNSVRDSGTLRIDQPAPGGAATVTIKGADFSLRSFPKEAVRPEGTAVPADKAYAVATTFKVHTPADIVREFGKPGATGDSRRLRLDNHYRNLKVQGFNPADVNTGNVIANDSLQKTLEISDRGSFNKYFGGAVGTPGNTPRKEFYPSDSWVGEGLPGGGTYRAGDTGVAGSQEVVALLRSVGPNPLYDYTASNIVCDSWDNSKLYLKEKDWKGAIYDTRTGGQPTGFGRTLGSDGKAVWITGYNNVKNPNAENATEALSADQVPALKVQYSATPASESTSACGDDKGPWYDNPGDVPGNDPQKAANGVYTGVSRVRAHFVMPRVVGPYTVIGTGYNVNVAVGYEVASGLAAGTVIPNWASTKRVISDTDQTFSMEEVLANDTAQWKETSYVPGATNGDSPTGDLGDRLIASDVFVRVGKKVRKGDSGAFSSVPPAVGGGDRVDYEITPSISSNALITGIRKEVWVEDCLPGSSGFVSATRKPALVLIGENPQDIKREACAAGDTYIRWVYPDAEANAAIEPIIVTTEVYDTAPDATYVNHVQIWGEGDASPVKKRQASANISVTNKTGLKLAKIALTPVLQVNLPGSTQRDIHRWRILLTNTAPAGELAVQSPAVIDILPKNGVHNTRYNGTFTFDSLVPKSPDADQWQIHYTATDSAQINHNPKDASNLQGGSTTWCDAAEGGQVVNGAAGACPASKADITAIRVIRPGTFPQGSNVDFEVAMVGLDNHAQENYVNRVAASAENLTFSVGPLDRIETTLAASVGDKFWIDDNGNGIQDPAEEGVADATVTLTGTDDLGNPVQVTTTTGQDGSYSFPALRASDPVGYTITFAIPDGFKTEKYEFTAANQGSDDSADSDATPAGVVTGVVLEAGQARTDIDAGLIKPAITLEKTAAPTVVNAGDTVTYTFTATNTGSAVLNNVTLEEESFTNAQGAKIQLTTPIILDRQNTTAEVSDNGGVITVTADPGEKVTWTATYLVKDSDLEFGKTIDNAAVVTGTSPAGTPVTSTDDAKVTPNGNPHYTVVKTAAVKGAAAGTELAPGTTITYTVKATNNSKLTVRDAKVKDDLTQVLDDTENPADLAVATEGAPAGNLLPDATFNANSKSINWMGDLAPGQVVTITYTVTTKSATDNGGNREVINVASPDGHPHGECVADEQCTTTHTIPAGSYHFSKTAEVQNKPQANGQVLSDDIIKYTVTVAHASGDKVKAAKIVDDLSKVLDDGELIGAPVASDGNPVAIDPAAKTLTWEGDLAIGASVTITYTVEVNAAGDKSLVNTVTNGGNNQGTCKAGAVCETTHTITPGRFTVAKTANPATGTQVLSDQEITYTVTLKHAGGDTVRNASIEDNLAEVLGDGKATYKANSLTASSGKAAFNEADKKITWTGDISHKAADPITITYTVTVDAVGEQTLRNTVTVTDGNGQCEAADKCATTHTVPKGTYTYSKTAKAESGSVVKSDEVITYTILVKHAEGDRVKDASIKDDFSKLLDHASYNKDAKVTSGNGTLTVDNGVLTWSGDLDEGASEEITFSVTVDAQGGATLVNTLSSEDKDLTRHSCDTTVGCQTTHTVQPGSFTYSKTADVANNAAVVSGDVITYTLTATHKQGDRVKDATFSDNFSEILKHARYNEDAKVTGPGAVTVKDGVLTWTGTLNDTNAREAVVTFSVKVNTDATVTLTNTLGSTDDRGECVADDMCVTNHQVPAGRFVYSKVANVANGKNVYSGDTLQYTLNVRHTGGNRIKGATITDNLAPLLANAVYNKDVTASAGTVTVENDVLTWTGDLDSKGTSAATITFSVTVEAKGEATLTNEVTTKDDRGTCDAAVGCTTTHVVPAGKFVYSKVAQVPSGSTVKKGDTITYTLKARHSEGDHILGAAIVDDLAKVLPYATYNNDAKADLGTVEYKEGKIYWMGDLARQAEATITFTVTATADGAATVVNMVTGTPENESRSMCDAAVGCATTHTLVPPEKPETITPKKKSAIPSTGSIAQDLAGAAALLMGLGVIAMAGIRRRRNS